MQVEPMQVEGLQGCRVRPMWGGVGLFPRWKISELALLQEREGTQQSAY